MTKSPDEVTASYYRCRCDSEFVDTFYTLFLAKSPEIARKFKKTHFERQKLMLRESLLEMLCFERGVAGTIKEIERLGRRHKELDVTPEMYTMWLDSLCEAIRLHDPEYTPELELRWRQAMQKGIEVMLAVE
jgi:hemoglobin-like flavoprotein